MAADGGDGWSDSTHVTAGSQVAWRDASDDSTSARRSTASFGGGGGPGFGATVRNFVRRYGWRAYALPILVIISAVALLTAHSSKRDDDRHDAALAAPGTSGAPRPTMTPSSSSPPVAPESIPLKSDDAGGAGNSAALKASALPPGGAFTMNGAGTFRVLKGTSKPVGSGPLFRYDIEIENGVTGVDVAHYAALVQNTLANPKSWSGHGVRVQRVDSGQIDFHVSLTSALTVRQFCGYDIHVETSCYAAAGSAPGLDINRVVLNVARWVRGASPYVADLNSYRIYMINHEDGHAMGHHHAHQCLPGGLAPVMMQQTFGVKSATTGKQCGANPWPYPGGAGGRGAPGAEQPDTPQNQELNLGD